jgi:hypothetical protein
MRSAGSGSRALTGRVRTILQLVGGIGWYPLFIALAWFLQIFNEAGVEVAPAARPLIAFVTVPLLLTLACTLFLGRERGALLAATGVVTLIAARTLVVGALPLAMAIVLVLDRRVGPSRNVRLPWSRIHEALTLVAALLLVTQVVGALGSATSGPVPTPPTWASERIGTTERPNIYVILSDGHGRPDVLEEEYGYKATTLVDALQAAQFTVAPNSRSNYLLTRFSLASFFTASYLTPIHDVRSEEVANELAAEWLYENPAFPLLHRAGYETVVVSSGYENLGLRSADRFVDTGQPNEFERVVMQNVAASQILRALASGSEAQIFRDRTLATVEATLEIGREAAPHPRFVFVHLPLPHFPFVFDETCQPKPPDTPLGGIFRHGGSATTVQLVAAQTQCVDIMLSRMADELVSLDPNSVILIMSDHGPDEHLDWWTPDARGVHERSANLFAYRAPGNAELFPGDVSLVNVLPILFNEYFGTSLATHENEIWLGARPQRPDFVRVDSLLSR